MVRIREARKADRDGIYEAHVASVRGVEPSEYTEREIEVWGDSLSPEMYSLSDEKSIFYVAEDGSQIVGLGKASLIDPEIGKLYVDATYQGQGIATRLTEKLERSMRDNGATSVYVEASLNAVSFYEHMGYTQVGSHEKPINFEGKSIEMTVADMEKQFR